MSESASINSGIALVTGANRGLGKEVSRQLASQGYTVIMTARQLDDAKQAAHELGLTGLIPAQLDITDGESIERISSLLTSTWGHLDVLINNAAIHYDTWQNALNVDMNIVQEAMDTNAYGAWRLVLALLPLLQGSLHARIVNVSSGAGSIAQGFSGETPAYALSKVALNALTMMLAAQLKPAGIMVNAVCPGWTATDMGGSGGRPVEKGARSIVGAATLPKDGATGVSFRDGEMVPW